MGMGVGLGMGMGMGMELRGVGLEFSGSRCCGSIDPRAGALPRGSAHGEKHTQLYLFFFSLFVPCIYCCNQQTHRHKEIIKKKIKNASCAHCVIV